MDIGEVMYRIKSQCHNMFGGECVKNYRTVVAASGDQYETYNGIMQFLRRKILMGHWLFENALYAVLSFFSS